MWPAHSGSCWFLECIGVNSTTSVPKVTADPGVERPSLPASARYRSRNMTCVPPMTSRHPCGSTREPTLEDTRAAHPAPAWIHICVVPMVEPDSSLGSGRLRGLRREATASVRARVQSNWCSNPPPPSARCWSRMTAHPPGRGPADARPQSCPAPTPLNPNPVVRRRSGRTAIQPALTFPSLNCREWRCA